MSFDNPAAAPQQQAQAVPWDEAPMVDLAPAMPDQHQHQQLQQHHHERPAGVVASSAAASTSSHASSVSLIKAALRGSESLAAAVSSGHFESAVDAVLEVVKPFLINRTINTSGGSHHQLAGTNGNHHNHLHHHHHPHHHPGQHHHHHHHHQQQQQQQSSLFPDDVVPDQFNDLFTMDPFGVDLMLNNPMNNQMSLFNTPPASFPPPAGHQDQHQQDATFKGEEAFVPASAPPPLGVDGIQASVQSEVNRLRTALLHLEQKASSASVLNNRTWPSQRMYWRVKVKKADNLSELLVKLKEFRKNMLAGTTGMELDQQLARMSTSNITSQKLSGCLEDFRACVTSFAATAAAGAFQISSRSSSHVVSKSTSELTRIASAVDDTNVKGLEAFTRLPLGDIFAKYPDVAASLKRLLQKQKMEVLSKLAELNATSNSSAASDAPIHHRPSPWKNDDDSEATDMSESD